MSSNTSNRLRRVIQQRNALTDDDGDHIVRVLRDYSEGRVEKREAAQQLRGYVPQEQQASLMGLDMDDLLPLVMLLLGGSQGRSQGGVGDLLSRFLGDRTTHAPQSGSDIGDLLGGLLGGRPQATPRQPSGDIDLRGLIGGLLDRNDNDDDNDYDRRYNDNLSSFTDLLGGLLGGDQGRSRGDFGSARDDDNDRDHNLRKRQ
jgi:hypothetical protein